MQNPWPTESYAGVSDVASIRGRVRKAPVQFPETELSYSKISFTRFRTLCMEKFIFNHVRDETIK